MSALHVHVHEHARHCVTVGRLHACACPTVWCQRHKQHHTYACCVSCRFASLTAELAQHIDSLQGINSSDAKVVAAAVFQKAAEACIINMQNVIEGLCHNLQKQAAKRAATAGAFS